MFEKKKAVLFWAFALGFILCSCAPLRPDIRLESASYSRYLKGLLSDSLGTPEEAAAFYRQVKVLDAQAPAPLLRLGFDYIRLKDYEKAVAEFKKVIHITPDDDYARYVLALLYIQLNDFKRAIEQYTILIDKNLENRAESVQLRQILSQLYFLNGDLVSARRQSAEILKLNPADTQGLYITAILDSEQGRVGEAIRGFQNLLEIDPDHAEAMNALAYLYAEQGVQLDKALVLVEKALELEPADGAYLDTAGWVYFKLGDYDRAVEYLKKASRFEFNPVILEHLGEACLKKGLMKEAEEAWSASLRLDPGQKALWEKLKILREQDPQR